MRLPNLGILLDRTVETADKESISNTVARRWISTYSKVTTSDTNEAIEEFNRLFNLQKTRKELGFKQ